MPCPVAWIIKGGRFGSFANETTGAGSWYFAVFLSFYTYKGHGQQRS